MEKEIEGFCKDMQATQEETYRYVERWNNIF